MKQKGLAPLLIIIIISIAISGYLLYVRQATLAPKLQKFGAIPKSPQSTAISSLTPSPTKKIYTPEEVITKSQEWQNKEIEITGLLKSVALETDKISGLDTNILAFSTINGIITITYTGDLNKVLGKQVTLRGIFELENKWRSQVGNLRISSGCRDCIRDHEPQIKAFENARKVKEKYESKIMQIPGVVCIGVGADDKNNPTILVCVVKLTNEIKQKIPSELDGIPVNIQETGEFQIFGSKKN